MTAILTLYSKKERDMQGLRRFGEYLTEFLVVTILVALSAVSVVFFIPMLVGLNGFFKNKKDVRLFKDIFLTMKENWLILIPYTIFELVIIVFPVLNIYYFNTHVTQINYVLLAVSYVALVLGSIYLVTGPTIIVNMRVTFFQLIYNGFMLLFGSLIRSFICLALMAGVIAIILLFPYVIPATFYAIPFIVTVLMHENFYVLKARVLKTTVYEIKKQEYEDNYLDERGRINHAKGDKE